MKNKGLIIGALVLFALVATSFTFAYWASSVDGDTQAQTGNTVTIGEGDTVTTTISFGSLVEDGNTLVPVGYEDGASTFSSTTFTFPVQWDADSSGVEGVVGDLTVTLGDPSITPGTLTLAELEAMFDIEVTTAPATLTEGAGTSNVIITVTFANEPATKAIYDEVANGTISFDVTFIVNPQ